MQLNKEETRFIGKWAKTKERGQWRYIITRGLLWGILVSILSKLFQSWDALTAWDTVALTGTFVSSDFLVRLCMYSAIGFGLHAYHWNEKNKRYNELKNMERKAQTLATAGKN